MKPAYFHGHPGATSEVRLAGLSPDDFAPPCPKTTHVIGFSLGGPSAIAFAATHPNVTHLDLIACPAPLGAVIPAMAGKPVFRSARAGLLRPLTSLQATLLRIAPNLFLKALFASTPASEQALLQGNTKAILRDSYRSALLYHRQNYLDHVQAFADATAKWPFDQITCKVTLWQGKADTWVLPDMADTLASHIPHAQIKRLPHLGHYGTLIHALRHISHN